MTNTAKKTASTLRISYDKNENFGFDVPDYAMTELSNDTGMDPKGLAYLLRNGLKQSLDDSIAGVAAGILGTARTEKANWSDEEREKAAKEIGLSVWTRQSLADFYIAYKQKARWESIVDGTMDTRTGGKRLTSEEKERRAIVLMFYTSAVEGFNAMQKKAGKTPKEMPEGAELTAALERYAAIPANEVKINAELTRRLEAKANAAEELDDLFGEE